MVVHGGWGFIFVICSCGGRIGWSWYSCVWGGITVGIGRWAGWTRSNSWCVNHVLVLVEVFIILRDVSHTGWKFLERAGASRMFPFKVWPRFFNWCYGGLRSNDSKPPFVFVVACSRWFPDCNMSVVLCPKQWEYCFSHHSRCAACRRSSSPLSSDWLAWVDIGLGCFRRTTLQGVHYEYLINVTM